MIVKEDILIIISYSGDTREIIDLLAFVKRIGVKVICITGNSKSKLAEYSDIVLEAWVEKEAEPSGMVPTASSTAALALGDALAIALMRKKGFSEQDFAFVHPKGQAGKKLLKIKASTLKKLMDDDLVMGYAVQTAISQIYFKRYIETMNKLQAIVMNIPIETH